MAFFEVISRPGVPMRFIPIVAAILVAAALPVQALAQVYTKPVSDIISRVQTNLNRVAHGLAPVDAGKATTDADRLVGVFSDLLNRNAQQKVEAQNLLDDIQRSIETRFDARQKMEPFRNLAKEMDRVERAAREEEAISPDDKAWKKIVVVAYQSLLLDSYDYWYGRREDLRGAIRLPCSITGYLIGSLEFSNVHLRSGLGQMTTCPIIGRFGPSERMLVLEDELIPFIERRRDWLEERLRSEEVDPAVPGFPFQEIAAYRQAVRKVEGDWGGSSAMGIYAALNERRHALMTKPQQYARPSAAPRKLYRTWSYLSLRNHVLIAEVDRLAAEAREKLVPYFIGKGVDPSRAELAASNGLATITLGGNCGDNVVPTSFRSLLLDGATIAEVKTFAAGDEWRNADHLQPFQSCAFFADLDPLAHIAVVDVQSFEYLRSLSASLTPGDRVALDLVLDIDARNEFDKTSLMTAAQSNRLDAVKWLIENGADVGARTDAEGLQHGRRTALMYAAASGSLQMIRTLLEAGADPHLADTTGKSALDYLVGTSQDDEPVNPVLSDEEFRTAYKLLR